MNRPLFTGTRDRRQFSEVNRNIALNLDFMCVCPCIHIETGLYCKFQYFCYPFNVWSKDGTDKARRETLSSAAGVALEGGGGRFAPCQKKSPPTGMPVGRLSPSVFVILINNTVFSVQCAVTVLWEFFTATVTGTSEVFLRGSCNGDQRGQKM